MKSNSFRAGQIFVWIPSKKAVFHYSGKSIQTAKRSSKCITERSSATGIDFFHKEQSSNFQWRSWSLLCSKSAWSEYPRKSCKFGMVLHHSVLRKVRPWKLTSRETRWPSAQKNNKPAEVLHLKRESEIKKVHFQRKSFKCSRLFTYSVFHGCNFFFSPRSNNWNDLIFFPETEKRFCLVK